MTKRNVAASVRARLLNHAREAKQDFSLVLTRYALERLFYYVGGGGGSSWYSPALTSPDIVTGGGSIGGGGYPNTPSAGANASVTITW